MFARPTWLFHDPHMLSAIQHGGYQTPVGGYFESWLRRLQHRGLIKRLRQGDVLLNRVNVPGTTQAVFRLMGELTSATNAEVVLLRTAQGRVLRLGISGAREVSGAGGRIIAHTHPNGLLGLSTGDFMSIFMNPRRARNRR